MRWLRWVVPIGVALVLLMAVGFKVAALLHPNPAEVIQSQLWLRLMEWLSAGSQWLIALWLLTGIASGTARGVTIALLCVFLGITGYRWYTGAADCGCFGSVAMHPRSTFLLDAIQLTGMLWTRSPAKSTNRISQAVYALAISISLPATILLATLPPNDSSSSKTVFLDVDSWVGKRCPLLEYIEGDPTSLLHRHVTLALIDRNCRHCQAYLTRLKNDSKAVGSVYVVDIASKNEGEFENPVSLPFKSLRLKPGSNFVAEVPIQLAISDGIVTNVTRE